MLLSLEHFFENFTLKVFVSLILSVLAKKHVALIFGFTTLVFLDCFTKWIALSSCYLRTQGKKEPSLYSSVMGIAAARRGGYITSKYMRERGLAKLMLYCICMLTASCADLVLAGTGSSTWLVNIMASYLTVTESLSVVENLSDAGVSSMAYLMEKIRRKL